MKIKPNCDYDECEKHNNETYAVVRDCLGIKVLCVEHFGFLRNFFKYITKCARNKGEESCVRNHAADLSVEWMKENTLRFDGTSFDLCPSHLRVYERCFNFYIL